MRPTELPARLAELLVRAWRVFPGRLMPPLCRYRPTCSQYMLRALRLHGLWRGGFMGTRRICRCHPWSPGGFDPVPDDTSYSRADYEAEILRQLPEDQQP